MTTQLSPRPVTFRQLTPAPDLPQTRATRGLFGGIALLAICLAIAGYRMSLGLYGLDGLLFLAFAFFIGGVGTIHRVLEVALAAVQREECR